MKGFGVLILALLIVVAPVSSGFSNSPCSDFRFKHIDGMMMTIRSRKLKEDGYTFSSDKTSSASNVNLDDYRPIDPVPSSKTSIQPGPIQHGTPLIPYIPKPVQHGNPFAGKPSPGHPKHGPSP